MTLERKRVAEIVPQYSLTGDLLSFSRCGLQYRYHSGSALPPSRPVQLWFGEFIHGVMENAFRLWSASRPPFPWPSNKTSYQSPAPAGRLPHDIGMLGDVVEATLRAQGKIPRSAATRDNAYERVERAVNDLGPHLFPLIASAEQRVIGTREVPATAAGQRARLYELHGIIDVVTSVQLSGAPTSNLICSAVQTACANRTGDFEVIVDYKGTRRNPTDHHYWDQGAWQVQTYAWLRTRQANALPVAAGVLLYVNELVPVASDLVQLQDEIAKGTTDVAPPNSSRDAYQLNTWRPGAAIPSFSLDFRLRRAIRVIPIDIASQAHATDEFDRVVGDIESCVGSEANAGLIVGQWPACGDEQTCSACDFRHFCPSPWPHESNYSPSAPAAP